MTSRSESFQTLTPDMLAEGAWRLGWLGLIYAISGTLEYLVRHTVFALTGVMDSASHAPDLFRLAGIIMGVGVFALSRSGWPPPKQLVGLGLVFEVAGAFAMAASEFWNGVPASAYTSFALVPIECTWIVAFPLIVPNSPRNVLMASLLAASAGPAAVAIASAVSGTAVDRPVLLATYFFTSNYLAAIAAYFVSRIVHDVHVRLKNAREIGSYELVERIGAGGMGEVWRAKHRLLARPAAIKLIRKDALGSNQRARDAAIRRFEREAQETAMLGSTHTVDVYDFGVTEESDFYYVMELLDGMSLEQLVERYGPVEPARAVFLLQQVCHSLGEAHERGLMHRDVKPANIFVCRLGPDDDFVKVLDFGLVKHIEPVGTMLTVEGIATGTPAYMAPEIASGRGDVDGRADLYAVGCVAYYLLTGRQVFERKGILETILAHVNDTPAPPSAVSELEIPPALDALILECLAKDPAARPPSAAVLAHRFAEAVTAGAWTSDAAHAWWKLHGASTADAGRSSLVASGASDPASSAAPRARCWPQFGRKSEREFAS